MIRAWPAGMGACAMLLSLGIHAQEPPPSPLPAPPSCSEPPCPVEPGGQTPSGTPAPSSSAPPATSGNPPPPAYGPGAQRPAYGPGAAQPPAYGPSAQRPAYGPGAQQPSYAPTPGYGPGYPPPSYAPPPQPMPPPGQPPAYGQPYGQPPYGQTPYGQPPHGQAPYGQPPYGPPGEGSAPLAEPEPSPPFFDLTVGTMFPLGLGPEATLEIPGRVLFQLDLTWMPGGYGKAIGALVGAVGDDNDAIRTVVDEALANSFVVRGSAGWRPFPAHGFELFLGYTGITVKGDVPTAAIAEVIDDDIVDELVATAPGNMKLKSQLHNIHVVVGWRWLALEDHLVIRANLGYAQTLGSKSSVEVSESEDLDARLDPIVNDQLGTILKDSVKMPLIGLNLGYRF